MTMVLRLFYEDRNSMTPFEMMTKSNKCLSSVRHTIMADYYFV